MASLHFVFSCMNAGKSTALLQSAHNYEGKGSKVLLLTSGIDDRSGKVGVISSRIGISREAAIYSQDTNFTDLLRDTKVACVFIDEAQFLNFEQVEQIHRWVHTSKTPVMCFGIRSDFRGKPFPGSSALLVLADKLQELTTICQCGKRATMNIRIDEQGRRVREGEQVLIGAEAHYDTVCGGCFYKD